MFITLSNPQVFASTAAWRRKVAEYAKNRLVEFGPLVLGTINVLGMAFGAILWFSGALSGSTVVAHDVSQIKGQIADLSTQMTSIRDRMDNGPRADQLREIDRHLSALDGRGDVLDQRLRLIEQQQAAQAARLEGIAAASSARLGGK